MPSNVSINNQQQQLTHHIPPILNNGFFHSNQPGPEQPSPLHINTMNIGTNINPQMSAAYQSPQQTYYATQQQQPPLIYPMGKQHVYGHTAMLSPASHHHHHHQPNQASSVVNVNGQLSSELGVVPLLQLPPLSGFYSRQPVLNNEIINSSAQNMQNNVQQYFSPNQHTQHDQQQNNLSHTSNRPQFYQNSSSSMSYQNKNNNTAISRGKFTQTLF